MMKDIVLVIKVTDQCNLYCPYCYYYAGGAASLRARKHKDLGEKLERLAETLKNSQVLAKAANILLVLHGGEPLLAPLEELDKFSKTLGDAFGARAVIALQTNGVLLDNKWIEMFARRSIFAGVSMDGPAHIHDRQRVHANGRGSHAEAAAGFKLLQAAAAAGDIPEPGLLAVFDPELTGADYFHHFIDEIGARRYDVLFPDDLERFPDRLSLVHAYKSMVEDTWRLWIARDDPKIRIRFINSALFGLLKGRSSLHDPDHQNTAVIDMAGDMFFEDNMRTLLSLENLKVGRWTEGGFDAAFERIEAAMERVRDYPDLCRQCEYFAGCKGGIPSYRLDPVTGEFGHSYLCDTYKMSFNFGKQILHQTRERAGGRATEPMSGSPALVGSV